MFNNEQQYYGQNYQPRQEHLSPRVPEWTTYNNHLLSPYSTPVAQPPYFPQHQYQNYTGLQSAPPLPSNPMPSLLNTSHPASNPSTSLARTNCCYPPQWHVNPATTPYSRNTRKYPSNCHPTCRSTCRYQKSPALANEPEATNRGPSSWYHPTSYWSSNGLPPPPRPPMPIPTNAPWQHIPSATTPSSSASASSSSLSVAPAPTRFSNEIKHSQARISRTLNHASPNSNELFSGYPSSFRPYVDSSRHIHKPTHESIPPIHSPIEAQNHPLINIPINPPTPTTRTSHNNNNNGAPPRLDLRQYLSTWDEADESIVTSSPSSSHRESANVNNNNQNRDSINSETTISELTSEQPNENTQQLLLVGTTENDLIECLLQKPETITAVDSKTGAILDLSMANKLSRFETSQTQGSSAAASILMEGTSNKELDFDFDCSFLQQSVNSSKKQINDIETTRDMPRIESPIIDHQTQIQRIINKSIPHIYEKSETEKIKKSDILLVTQSSRPQSAPPNSMALELSTTPDNIPPPSLSDLSETNEFSDKITKNSSLTPSKLLDNTMELTESQTSPLNKISNKNQESKTKTDLESEERRERPSEMSSTHLPVNSDMLWHPRLQSVIKRVHTFSQPCEELNSSVENVNKEFYLSDKTKTPEEKLSLPNNELSPKSLEEKNAKLGEEPNLENRDIVVPFVSDKDRNDCNQGSIDKICPKSYLDNELEKKIFYPHFSVANKKHKDLEFFSKKENALYFSNDNIYKDDSSKCIQNPVHELKSPDNGIVFDCNKTIINPDYITTQHNENVKNDSICYQENMLISENTEEMTSASDVMKSLSNNSKSALLDSTNEHLDSDFTNISKNNSIQKKDSQENQCISPSPNYFSINSETFKDNIKNDDYSNKCVHNKILSPINTNQDQQEEMPKDYTIDEIVKEKEIETEKDHNKFNIANLFSGNNILNNREEIKSNSFDENINLPREDTPQSITSSPEGALHILEEENSYNQESSMDVSEKSNHLEKITNNQDNKAITSFNQNNTIANDDQNLDGDISFRENELNTDIREPIDSNENNNEIINRVTNPPAVEFVDRDTNSSTHVEEGSSQTFKPCIRPANELSVIHPIRRFCETRQITPPLIPPVLHDPIVRNVLANYENVSHEEMIESEDHNDDYGLDSSNSLTPPEPSEFSLFMYQGNIPLSMLSRVETAPTNPEFTMENEDSFLPFSDDAAEDSEDSDLSNDQVNINGKSRRLENKIEDVRRYKKELSFGSTDGETSTIIEVTSEKLREKAFNSNIVLYECISQTRYLTFKDYTPGDESLNRKQRITFKILEPKDSLFKIKPNHMYIKNSKRLSKKHKCNKEQKEKHSTSKARDKHNNYKIDSINTDKEIGLEESTSIIPKNNNGHIININTNAIALLDKSDINNKHNLKLNTQTTNKNTTSSIEINNQSSLTKVEICSNAKINHEINNETTVKINEISSKENIKDKIRDSNEVSSQLISEKSIVQSEREEYLHQYKQSSRIIQRYKITNNKRKDNKITKNSSSTKNNLLNSSSFLYKKHKFKKHLTHYNTTKEFSNLYNDNNLVSNNNINNENTKYDPIDSLTNPPRLESIQMLREESIPGQKEPPLLEPMAETFGCEQSKIDFPDNKSESVIQSHPSLPRVVIRRDIAGYTSHLKPPKEQLQPVVLLRRSPELDILANSILNDRSCSIFLRFRNSPNVTENNNESSCEQSKIDFPDNKSESVIQKCIENETSHTSHLPAENPNLSPPNSDNPAFPLNTNTNINKDCTAEKELDPSPSSSKETIPNESIPNQLKVSIPLKFKTSKSFDIESKKQEKWVMAEDFKGNINKEDMLTKKYPLSLKIVRENSLSKKNTAFLKASKKEHHEIETKVNYHSHKGKILKSFSKNKKKSVLVKASQLYTSPFKMTITSPTDSERSHLNQRDEQQDDLTQLKENTKKDSTELSSKSLNHHVPSSSKMGNIINQNDLSKPSELNKKFKKKSPKKLKPIHDYYSSSSSDETPPDFNQKLNKLSCNEHSFDFQDKETLSHHMKKHHDNPARRERHHCCLCERSFDSRSKYAKHTSGRWHRLIERSQRRAIDAVCSVLTGQPCPGLNNNSTITSATATTSPSWCTPEPGRVDHFHKTTPLDKALQNLMKVQKDRENPSSATHIATMDKEDSSKIVP